jgi:hypothetical protein
MRIDPVCHRQVGPLHSLVQGRSCPRPPANVAVGDPARALRRPDGLAVQAP